MAGGLMRLNKLVALRGWGSRREANKLIANGWVKVDGKTTDLIGTIVDESVKLELSKEGKNHIKSQSTTVILNKPLGIVSTQPEDRVTSSIKLLTPANYGGNPYTKPRSQHHMEPFKLRKLSVAGRLDINTTGLLVFTQSGRLAAKIIGPESKIEKEYLVRVISPDGSALTDPARNLDVENKLDRLREGIQCSGDLLECVSSDVINENQIRMVLHAGKIHHIRRMFDAVGWGVKALKRVRIGSLELGSLEKGKWRYLMPNEEICNSNV